MPKNAAKIIALKGAHPVTVLDEAIDSLPFDRIQCPDLRAMGQLWLSLPRHEGEKLPRWATFSPQMAIPYLRKICVMHVGDWENDEIEFTLYGGHATDRVGNGQRLVLEKMREDPLRRPNYSDIRERAGRAVDHSAPQYARKTLSWDGCDDVEYELLMLPFMPENGFSRVLQPLTSDQRPETLDGGR